MRFASLLLCVGVGLACPTLLQEEEPLTLHIVPHSYDAPLFQFIDDFYPWAQSELMQRHFDNLFE
jgi:hypothetical protein